MNEFQERVLRRLADWAAKESIKSLRQIEAELIADTRWSEYRFARLDAVQTALAKRAPRVAGEDA